MRGLQTKNGKKMKMTVASALVCLFKIAMALTKAVLEKLTPS